mgnify:CR=1 FL=1
MLERRGEYRRRECLVCGHRFSTKEIVMNRTRGKTPTKRRKTPVPTIAPNTREQVIKNASARRRLEDMRDSMDGEYDYEY